VLDPAPIEGLDAVVHLAGALGRPVWAMLPFAPDWRWQLDREDSPWYPSLRIFRQDHPGDWSPVFERITSELTRMGSIDAGGVGT
jgi:hypothetical protein